MKNYLTKLGVPTIVLVAAVISSTAAAYTLTNDPDCAIATAVFNPQYSSCVGAYELGNGENDVTDGSDNNIVNNILNVDKVFDNQGGWSFIEKVNEGVDEGTYFDITYNGDTKSGSLVFDVTAINNDFGPDFLSTYEIAISFKAADSFSIYQWDAPLGVNTIEWTTNGTATNKNGGVQGLSHASLYFRNTANITEPPSSALLALGLVCLGLSRRRLVFNK